MQFALELLAGVLSSSSSFFSLFLLFLSQIVKGHLFQWNKVHQAVELNIAAESEEEEEEKKKKKKKSCTLALPSSHLADVHPDKNNSIVRGIDVGATLQNLSACFSSIDSSAAKQREEQSSWVARSRVTSQRKEEKKMTSASYES